MPLFECDSCDRVFTNRDYLSMHQVCHPKVTPGHYFECRQCAVKFVTRNKLEKHEVDQHYGTVLTDVKNSIEGKFKCSLCKVDFLSRQEMCLHRIECRKKLPRTQTRSACKCGKSFKAVRFLNNHVMTCPSSSGRANQMTGSENNNRETPRQETGDSWKCDALDCNKRFSKYIQFKNHLYTHTEYPFNCGVKSSSCRWSFTRQDAYVEHGIKEHGIVPELKGCTLCDLQFSTEDDIYAHMERVHDDDSIADEGEKILGESFSFDEESSHNLHACKMDDCDKVFHCLSQLRRHYVSHNETLRICSKCNGKFSDRDELNEHALSEHNLVLGSTSCPFCQDVFSLKKYLLDHLQVKHPQPWICSTCDLPMLTVADARKHKERHAPKPCDICKEVFFDSDELLKHLIGHDVDIDSCPVQGCNVFFGQLENFEKHLLQHQEDKIFKCQKCEYQCYNLRQLECHLGSGHLQRPKPNEFTSDINIACSALGCDQSFVSEKWLVKHVKLDHASVQRSWRFRVKHSELGSLLLPSKDCLSAYNKCQGWVVNLERRNLGDLLESAAALQTREESPDRLQKLQRSSKYEAISNVLDSKENLVPQLKIETSATEDDPRRMVVFDIAGDHTDAGEKELEFVNSAAITPVKNESPVKSELIAGSPVVESRFSPAPSLDDISLGDETVVVYTKMEVESYPASTDLSSTQFLKENSNINNLLNHVSST